MGNVTSSEVIDRRRNAIRRIYTAPPQQPPPHPPQPQPEINPNQYVFAAGMPYPTQYYNYPQGYYPPQPQPQPQPQPPVPLPYQSPYDHHHHRDGSHMAGHPPNWGGYPYGLPMTPPPPPVPYIEHQKAVTVKNDVNLKKETLKLEADEENPGKFLVTFTFDSTVAGRMTVMFFAKEGEDCNLIPVKENILQPVTLPFEQGIGQKFRQPSGTGIDFSMFEESELLKVDAADVFPLAVKAESLPANANESNGKEVSGGWNSQITLAAVFEKDKGKYQARAVKQILWVNGMRYELQEIYGIRNSVNNDAGESDAGKDCVICLTEPRDTTVLPCRHMCMCSSCAQVLKCQTNRCPVCRQPVERLLEIKVNNGTNE